MKNKSSLSIIIPVYNEIESLKFLIDEIHFSLKNYNNYCILFIDDGSNDGSSEFLNEVQKNDLKINLIEFTINKGKSAALNEGFKWVESDYVITMDADLQDDPSEIPNLLKKLDDGYDLVSGWKKKRNDPLSKTLPSKLFNFTTSFLTGIKIHDFNCGLKAYKKTVIKSINLYGGLHRYIPVIAFKKGFKVDEFIVNHRPRKFGNSKYGNERYFKGLFDLITVLFLTKYLKRPLHLFGFFGFLFSVIGFFINLWVLYLKYYIGEPFSKHIAILVLGVMLIIIGVQFFSIGLIGEMIVQSNHKSFDEKDEIIFHDKN